MNEPYALILFSVIVAVLHAYFFSSLYGKRFERQFMIVKSGLQEIMVDQDADFAESIKDKLEEDSEPPELIEFGEEWKRKLEEIERLDDRRKKMSGHVRFAFWLVILTVIWAVMGIMNPNPILEAAGQQIYNTSVSWGILFATLIFMIYFLILFRELEVTVRLYEADIEEHAIKKHLAL